MENFQIENIIESIIFSSELVPLDKLAEILLIDETSILSAIQNLKTRYSDTSLEILVIDGNVQICTKKEYHIFIKKFLHNKKNNPLSNASLEVLAIIAYNQPVTKSFIERVRGVDSSSIVNSLIDKELIQECGRMNLPGRPLSYSITSNFLRCFNLNSIDELPSIQSFDRILSEKQNDLLHNQLSL